MTRREISGQISTNIYEYAENIEDIGGNTDFEVLISYM
jgi:hypothetical protein